MRTVFSYLLLIMISAACSSSDAVEENYIELATNEAEIVRAERLPKAGDQTEETEEALKSGLVDLPILSIKDNVLILDGSLTQPTLEGNSSLDIVKTFRMGASDLYVLQDTGGTACPALFHIAEVTRSGFRLSAEFETCSDLANIKKVGDVVQVSMPGFMGPFEGSEEQEAAATVRNIFRYKDGEITETKR